MDNNLSVAYEYLLLSGVLTALMWLPYITARIFIWGLPAFLHNYPAGYPAREPSVPLWVERSRRVHLNMIENLPAFTVVVIAAGVFTGGDSSTSAQVAMWTQVFFYSRIVHAVVYTLGVPGLRVPVYTVSWVAILVIAALALL